MKLFTSIFLFALISVSAVFLSLRKLWRKLYQLKSSLTELPHILQQSQWAIFQMMIQKKMLSMLGKNRRTVF